MRRVGFARGEKDAPLVLVTGCSGYVASHIVLLLLRKGYRVRGSLRASERGEGDELVARHHDDDVRRRFEETECDLLEDQGWDEAMRGVSFVLHVASPVHFAGRLDDEMESIFKPALAGTRRVMGAAARANSVRRVVITSSVAAAIERSRQARGPFDESCFTDPWDADEMAYNRSKAFAELCSWLFAEKRPMSREELLARLSPPERAASTQASATDASLVVEIEEIERAFASASACASASAPLKTETPTLRRLDVVVICPAYVIGPVLLERHVGKFASSSSELVRSVMNQATLQLAQPPLSLPVVDVRDVATLQLIALEHEGEGVVGHRFIAGAGAASGNLSFTETAAHIRKHFASRGYNPCPRKLPRGAAYVVGSLLPGRERVQQLVSLGRNMGSFSNEKATALLRARDVDDGSTDARGFRSLEESVVDTAESFIALGVVEPPASFVGTVMRHARGAGLLPLVALLLAVALNLAPRLPPLLVSVAL